MVADYCGWGDCSSVEVAPIDRSTGPDFRGGSGLNALLWECGNKGTRGNTSYGRGRGLLPSIPVASI